jgi:hypothetical protein
MIVCVGIFLCYFSLNGWKTRFLGLKTESDFKDLGVQVFPGIPVSRRRVQLADDHSGIETVKCRVVSLKNLDATSGEVRFGPEDGWLEFPSERLSERLYLQPGDSLLTARGSLYKVALVRGTAEIADEHVVASSNLIVVRPSAMIMPELIFAFLRSDEVEAELSMTRRGSSIGVISISARLVESLRIGVPTPEEQERLGELLRLGNEQYRLSQTVASLRRDIAERLVLEQLEVGSNGE